MNYDKWYTVVGNKKIKKVLWGKPFKSCGKTERTIHGLNGIRKESAVFYKGEKYIIYVMLPSGLCLMMKSENNLNVCEMTNEIKEVCITKLTKGIDWSN